MRLFSILVVFLYKTYDEAVVVMVRFTLSDVHGIEYDMASFNISNSS